MLLPRIIEIFSQVFAKVKRATFFETHLPTYLLTKKDASRMPEYRRVGAGCRWRWSCWRRTRRSTDRNPELLAACRAWSRAGRSTSVLARWPSTDQTFVITILTTVVTHRLTSRWMLIRLVSERVAFTCDINRKHQVELKTYSFLYTCNIVWYFLTIERQERSL